MKHLTVHYPLIGQEAEYNDAAYANSGGWTFPDDALTPSTKKILFGNQHPDIAAARTVVAWWPLSNAQLRFVHFDDGPSNITNFGSWYSHANSTSPVVQSQNVTTAFQALIDAGVSKHIGYQLAGQCKVGKAEIEVVYKIPDDLSAEVADLQTRVAALESA